MARLDRDLVCATEPGLKVRGQLDMAGFTLTCDGSERGIVLVGRRSGLQNGKVEGCGQAVVLAGRGRHQVVSVRARARHIAFLVESRGNSLVGNEASAREDDAFRVQGGQTYLVDNRALAAGDDGIDLQSSRNTVTQNTIVGAAGNGIEVGKSGNMIFSNHVDGAGGKALLLLGGGNRAIGNTLNRSAAGLQVEHRGGGARGSEILGNMILGNRAEGILIGVSSNDNRIVGNEVEGNGTDLADQHPACHGNLWQSNLFNSAEPASCIR